MNNLKEQARAALVAHYTRKGLKGDELARTVDKAVAVQFKPRPENPFGTEEALRTELARQQGELAKKQEEIASLTGKKMAKVIEMPHRHAVVQ